MLIIVGATNQRGKDTLLCEKHHRRSHSSTAKYITWYKVVGSYVCVCMINPLKVFQAYPGPGVLL